MLEALKNLLKIKSIMTLIAGFVFGYMAISGNHHNGVHVLFYQRDKMKQIWHCDEMSESHLKNKA